MSGKTQPAREGNSRGENFLIANDPNTSDDAFFDAAFKLDAGEARHLRTACLKRYSQFFPERMKDVLDEVGRARAERLLREQREAESARQATTTVPAVAVENTASVTAPSAPATVTPNIVVHEPARPVGEHEVQLALIDSAWKRYKASLPSWKTADQKGFEIFLKEEGEMVRRRKSADKLVLGQLGRGTSGRTRTSKDDLMEIEEDRRLGAMRAGKNGVPYDGTCNVG